jgi:hypothetical protein
VSARQFEIIKRPGLIVPEAALRRRSICYSGSPPPAVAFEGVNNVIDKGNSHTHSGLSFGSAKSDRLLIATLTYDANNIAGLGSVTIGGVPATRLVKRLYNQSAGATLTPSSEIWAASVPTGTSGSVVLNVNTSGNPWTSSVAIYAATGLRGTTPTATMSSDDVSHFGTLNMSVSVQGGGFAIATAYFEGSGTATSSTWTGATQTFFDAMNNSLGGEGAQSDALASVTSTQTVNTTTKFNGGSLIGIVGCIAAFR